jgi:hypothetical protein
LINKDGVLWFKIACGEGYPNAPSSGTLDEFWEQRLGKSRNGIPWHLVLQTLVTYRLIDPGSEWRLHRHWLDHSSMADLLGEDFRLAQKNVAISVKD